MEYQASKCWSYKVEEDLVPVVKEQVWQRKYAEGATGANTRMCVHKHVRTFHYKHFGAAGVKLTLQSKLDHCGAQPWGHACR